MKKQEYIKPNTETIKIETSQIIASTTIQQLSDEGYDDYSGEVMGD